MERLIAILVIAAITAVANWFKKQKAKEAGSNSGNTTARPLVSSTRQNNPPPPLAAPPPVAKPTSWEEELRRLLEGETPMAPPPRPRPTPPVAVAPPAPRPVAPPPVRPAGPPTSMPRPIIAPPPFKPVVARESRPAPKPLPVPAVTTFATKNMAPMAASRQAYESARQLDKTMSAHIDRIPGERVKSTWVTRAQAAPELTQAVALFKNSRTARHAVLASVILGPPKALDQSASLF